MKSLFITMIGIIAIMTMLTGCSNYSEIEESATPVVNQIIKANLGANSANCESVKVTKKVSDNFYHAVAYLDNGEDVKVTIKVAGDQIYVTIAE